MGAYQAKPAQHQANTDNTSKTHQSKPVGRTDHFSNSPQDLQQKGIQELADNSKQVKQLQLIQKKLDEHQSGGNNHAAPVQRKKMTPKQLTDGGFTGPHQGNTFQYNFPGSHGVHATVRLENTNTDTTHYHIRKDSKGGVYNRINYNEVAPNNWEESDVNVPAGASLQAQMQQRGREMKNWMNKQK